MVGFLLTMWRLKANSESMNSRVKSSLPPISVIIAARNDLAMLKKNLDYFLNQDYPTFEVIVVNDRSNDGTEEYLIETASGHFNMRIVSISSTTEVVGKKNALANGIDEASYDHLVFSDADCRPNSNQWLFYFGKSFASGFELIIGFGLFERIPHSLSNALYRLEALKIALRYSLSANLGKPYMAVGRSLGYTKNLYRSVNGFQSHMHIQSGDDDLFVQSLPKKTKTKIEPKALTISETPSSFKSWFLQKQRHLTTGNNYRWSILIALGLNEFSELLMFLGVIYLGTKEIDYYWGILFALILIRYFLFSVVIAITESIINYKSVKFKEIWLELFLSILNPLFSVASQLRQSEVWIRRK